MNVNSESPLFLGISKFRDKLHVQLIVKLQTLLFNFNASFACFHLVTGVAALMALPLHTFRW